MKHVKTLSALLFAIVLVLGLSVSAMAAESMTGEAGVIGEFTTPDTPTVQSGVVTIYKEITAYNPETCVVNAPTVTYSYAIAAGDANKTITDAYSHHDDINGNHVNATVKTKAGVGSPVITAKSATVTTGSSLVITPADQLDASENGTANRFDIDIDFSAIDYTTAGTGAGVYRYVITETCAEATKNAAGIKEGEVANTLYMDVYVDGDGEVYGYVLFTNNGDIDASPDKDGDAAEAAGKTEGFVGSEADGDAYASDTSKADKYYTFNLDLPKVVVNDAYASSTKHQFPFTVTLANSSVTAAVLPKLTVGANATQAALTAGAIGGTTWTPKIADGATINYVGIPCGTTVTVKETNDVAGVTYQSVSTNADTDAAEKSIDTGVDSNNAIVNCGATALAKATENHTSGGAGVLTFTNTLIQISPTGVALRVAPYAIMMGSSVALLAVGRRRKEEEA